MEQKMRGNHPNVSEQLQLFGATTQQDGEKYARVRQINLLIDLLDGDLDFHDQRSNYATHNFHSFPAKFPPQLPKRFIETLTEPGELVLDPMSGSGTTVLEAYLADRRAVGFDIDPLAIRLARVKTTPVRKTALIQTGHRICGAARDDLKNNVPLLDALISERFEARTREFADYWFHPETQRGLAALCRHIEAVEDERVRNFFEIAFSSVIITKSGGVSLAFDLGHTRPHRTKVLMDQKGDVLFGEEHFEVWKKKNLIKTLKSPVDEFEKRFQRNINGLLLEAPHRIQPVVSCCDSQRLCLKNESVDLIVTSPPYAANAIDYMRAHKFSLTWLGFTVDQLTVKRRGYIGSESVQGYEFEPLPAATRAKVDEISAIDEKRGKVLWRYYSEMSRSLREMLRVLRPGKAAIVVVGSSVMRGVDTETHNCLKEIGESFGFHVPRIGVRKLDRNKRMMPVGMKTDPASQIQQRMHEEYVIGFYKP